MAATPLPVRREDVPAFGENSTLDACTMDMCVSPESPESAARPSAEPEIFRQNVPRRIEAPRPETYPPHLSRHLPIRTSLQTLLTAALGRFPHHSNDVFTLEQSMLRCLEAGLG